MYIFGICKRVIYYTTYDSNKNNPEEIWKKIQRCQANMQGRHAELVEDG